MTPRLLLATAAVLSALAAAGCTATPEPDPVPSGPTDASPTDGTGPAAKQPSCALAPPSLIKSALGLDVNAPTSSTNPPVVVCTYTGLYTVILRFQGDEDAASFARGRAGFETSGQPTTDVTGFMDQAYHSSVEFGDVVTTTLVARKGSLEILLTAVATLDAEKALVAQLFAGLS